MPKNNVVDIAIRLQNKDLLDQLDRIKQAGEEAQRIIQNIGKTKGRGANTGIADGIREDIDSLITSVKKAEDAINGIQLNKVGSKQFENTVGSLTAAIGDLDKRTTNLEGAMTALISGLSHTDDAGKFTSMLDAMRASMAQTKEMANETVSALNDINAAVKSSGNIGVVNEKSLKDRSKALSSVLKEIDDTTNLDYEPSLFSGSVEELEKKLKSTINNFKDSLKKLESVDIGSEAFVEAAQNASIAGRAIDDMYAALYDKKTNTPFDSFINTQFEDSIKFLRSQVAGAISQINDDLSSIGTNIEPQVEKTVNSLSIPLNISTNGSTLAKKALEIIRVAQNSVTGNPLEVELILTSGWATKKNKKLLQNFQEQVNNLSDESVKAEFQGLIDDIQKGFGEEINLKITSNIDKAKGSINEGIREIQNTIDEKTFYVDVVPKLKESEKAEENIQAALDKVKLTLKNVSIGKQGVKTLQSSLNNISESLKIIIDNIEFGNNAKISDLTKALNGSSSDSKQKKKTKSNTTKKDETSEEINKADNEVFDLTSSCQKLLSVVSELREELKTSPSLGFDDNTINSVNNIRDALYDVLEVFEKFTGIKSTGTLDYMFSGIGDAVANLEKFDLRLKSTQNIFKQYDEYRIAGGLRDITELSDDSKIQKKLSSGWDKYLLKQEQAVQNAKTEESTLGIKQENSSLQETGEAAKEAANGKEKFADANKELLSSIVSSLSGIVQESDGLNALNRIINNLGGKNGPEKTAKLVDGLRQIIEVLNTPIDENSMIEAITKIADSTDKLENLATVLKATKKQLDSADGILTQDETADTQKRFDDDIENISKNASQYMSQYGKVLTTTIKKLKDSIQAESLISYEDEFGEKKIRKVVAETKNGIDFKNKSLTINPEEATSYVTKMMKMQKAFERMQQAAKNKTDEEFLKDDVDADKWAEMIQYAKAYEAEIGNIVKVTRQVREDSYGNLLESFSFFGDKGGHVTMGREGEVVASSQKYAALDETAKAYDSLTKSIDKYIEARSRIADGTSTIADQLLVEKIDAEYQKLASDVDEVNGKLKTTSNAAQEAKNRYDAALVGELDKKLSEYDNGVDSIISGTEIKMRNQLTGLTPDIQLQLNGLKELRQQLQTVRKELSDQFKIGNVDDSKLKEAYSLMKNIDDVMVGLKDNSKVLVPTSSVDTLLGKVAKDMADNGLSGELLTDFEKLKARLEEVRVLSGSTETGLSQIDKITFKQLDGEFRRLHKLIYTTGQDGKGFVKSLSGAIGSQTTQFLAQFFSIQDIIRYSRTIASTVTAVDSALIELQKVSDATDERISQSFDHSAAAAQQYGATITEVINSTADWARMGYSVDESEELAKVTQLYQNVGDNISQEEASKALIATLQGFQIKAEDAVSIIDKFNEVSNNFAIDTYGIGQALERSAASFYASHTDLSKSIALVTTANTVLQNPETVGTVFKTLSARLRGATTDLEELGEEQDEYTASTSKLQDLVKGLTGFDIMQEDGKTYKDIYEILHGIGQEWENLSDIDQASLSEALAGKRNSNALFAVLQNIDTLEDAYRTAENAAGSAAREEEDYEKSVQYRIDQVKASLQELEYDFLSSDTLIKLIKLANQFLQVIDKIVDRLGSTVSILTGVGLFSGVKGILSGDKGFVAQIVRMFADKTLGEEVTGNMLTNIAKMISKSRASKKLGDALGDTVSQAAKSMPIEDAAVEAARQAALRAAGKTAGDGVAAGIKSAAVTGGTEGGEVAATSFVGSFAKVLGGAALAAVIGYAIYSAVQAHRDAMVAEATTEGNELNQRRSDLESTMERIKELRAITSNPNSSEQENYNAKVELLSIQQSLVASNEELAGSIDLVNGSLENQTNLLNGISSKEANDFLSKNVQEIKRATTAMTSSDDYWLGNISKYDANADQIKAIADTFEEIKLLEEGQEYRIFFSGNIAENNQDLLDFITQLRSIENESYGLTDILGGATDLSGNFEKTIDKYEDLYNTALEAQLIADSTSDTGRIKTDSGLDIMHRYTEAANTLNDAILGIGDVSIDDAQQGWIEMQGVVDRFLQNNPQYTSMFKEIKDLVNENNIPLAQFKQGIQDTDSELNGLANTVKGLGLTNNDIFDILTGESNGDGSTEVLALAKAFGILSGESELTTDDITNFIGVLTELGYVASDSENPIANEAAQFKVFKASAQSAMDTISNLSAAVKSANDGNGLTITVNAETGNIEGEYAEVLKMVDAVNKTLPDTNKYDTSDLFIRTANGIRLDTEALAELNEQYNTAQIEAYNQELVNLNNLYLESLQAGDNARSDQLRQQIEETQMLKAGYEGMNSAYQNWLNSQNGDKGDMFDSLLGSGISTYNDKVSKGEIGDSQVQAMIRMMTGQNVVGMRGDTAEYQALLDQTEAMMDRYFTSDDATVGMDRFIADLQAAGAVIQNESGGFDWVEDVSVDNIVSGLQDVNSELSYSPSLVEILIDKLEDYAWLNDWRDNTTKLNDLLAELAAGGSLEALEAQIREVGEAEGLADEQINQMIADATGTPIEKDVKYEADTTEVDETNAEIEENPKTQEIQYHVDHPENAVNGNPNVQMTGVVHYENAVQTPAPTTTTPTGTTVTNTVETKIVPANAADRIGQLSTKIGALQNKTVTVTANVNGVSQLNAVMSYLNQIEQNKNKTITITTVRRAAGGNSKPKNGDDTWQGTAAAHGSYGLKHNSPHTLTGELGQELVVRGSDYFTVGDNGAEFADLKRGDIVFNHKQTEQLFKYGRINSRGKALAEGTAMAGISGGGGQGGSNASSNKRNRNTTNAANAVTHAANAASNAANTVNKSSGSTKKNAQDTNKAFKELFDWIEVTIDRIERKIESINKRVENAYIKYGDMTTKSLRIGSVAEEISEIEHEIRRANQGVERYKKQAKRTKKTKDYIALTKIKDRKTKKRLLNNYDEYTKRIREGEKIDISTITNENLYNAVKNYQEWWEKALDLHDKAEQLALDRLELFGKRFDLYQQKFEETLDRIQHGVDMMDSYVSLTEAKSNLVDKQYYEQQIKYYDAEGGYIDKLKEEYETLVEQQKLAKDGGVAEGSEEWNRMQTEIEGVAQSIVEAQTKVEEWNKKIRELDWNLFDKTQENISFLIDELDFIYSLYDTDKFFDDIGTATDRGIAAFGINAMQYNAYLAQAQQYADAIEEINGKLTGNDEYDQDLLERRKSLTQSMWQATQAAHAERDAIRDLVKQGFDKEIEALKKSIDEYTDLLDAQKDAYDYQRNIADKQKEISILQKRLSAYAGDDSEEGAANRQKTLNDLREAQRDLEETQNERLISETKNILSDLSDQQAQIFEDRLDRIDELITAVIEGVNDNASTVSATIEEAAGKVGYSISDELKTAISGEGLVRDYQNGAWTSNDSASLLKAIDKIVAFTEAMAEAAAKEAGTTLSKYTTRGYASGSKRIPTDQFAWTDENGPETIIRKSDGAVLTRLNLGDSVLKNMASNNLWNFANNPSDFIKSLRVDGASSINTGDITVQNNITFDMQNVTDYRSFMNELRRDSSFEKVIQEMTVGQMLGHNSLKKNSIRI